jgi:hypothetical protein
MGNFRHAWLTTLLLSAAAAVVIAHARTPGDGLDAIVAPAAAPAAPLEAERRPSGATPAASCARATAARCQGVSTTFRQSSSLRANSS